MTDDPNAPYPGERPQAPYPDGFQQMPGVGGQAARGPVERPPSIVTAVKLMWGGAALSLINIVITLVTLGQLRSQVRDQVQQQGGLSPDQVDTAVNVGVTVGIVSGIVGGAIGVGLWILMAWANGKGKTWARIVATILGAIYLVSFLASAGTGRATAVALVVGGLILVVDVVTVFLLWRKDSSEYYRAVSQPRWG